MRVLYFAWVRDMIGKDEEAITLPDEITTLGALVDWLTQSSPGHANAFEHRDKLKAAVNQEFANWDHPIKNGDEIALFPPVTGG